MSKVPQGLQFNKNIKCLPHPVLIWINQKFVPPRTIYAVKSSKGLKIKGIHINGILKCVIKKKKKKERKKRKEKEKE